MEDRISKSDVQAEYLLTQIHEESRKKHFLYKVKASTPLTEGKGITMKLI